MLGDLIKQCGVRHGGFSGELVLKLFTAGAKALLGGAVLQHPLFEGLVVGVELAVLERVDVAVDLLVTLLRSPSMTFSSAFRSSWLDSCCLIASSTAPRMSWC
ncbi:hypothetical protein UK23_01845 [Lentzea aerocolonigenes]|uniref:Uncharacterized protein n=1 Tax=Lentzea aerocolonigenes TaxID=68170 RepID=A0A0F0HC33_LENAE|nr:hypothetical protein UK23_01845 [Lentzea aerocolonigenes]